MAVRCAVETQELLRALYERRRMTAEPQTRITNCRRRGSRRESSIRKAIGSPEKSLADRWTISDKSSRRMRPVPRCGELCPSLCPSMRLVASNFQKVMRRLRDFSSSPCSMRSTALLLLPNSESRISRMPQVPRVGLNRSDATTCYDKSKAVHTTNFADASTHVLCDPGDPSYRDPCCLSKC